MGFGLVITFCSALESHHREVSPVTVSKLPTLFSKTRGRSRRAAARRASPQARDCFFPQLFVCRRHLYMAHRLRDKGLMVLANIKLIGPATNHPELEKRAVDAVPIVAPVELRPPLQSGTHHSQTAHDRRHHSQTELINLAEILRSALEIDPRLPVRCTLEEACYRLSASGKIDKTAFLVDRAWQCVEVVRAIQEKKQKAAAAAVATPKKADKLATKVKPGAKAKPAAKARPAANAKSAGARPAATTKVRRP